MTYLKVCIITIFLTVAYLTVSVLISNILFYHKANGSIIRINSKCIGSKLIGQQFTKEFYFHGRPSAFEYKISGNSNFPYYSHDLSSSISRNKALFTSKNFDKEPTLNIISESASGLDPHITHESALIQCKRVAQFTMANEKTIIELVNKTAKPRIFGLFGERIVNLIELNLKIKELYGKKNRT